jgi:hypothetical protein
VLGRPPHAELRPRCGGRSTGRAVHLAAAGPARVRRDERAPDQPSVSGSRSSSAGRACPG